MLKRYGKCAFRFWRFLSDRHKISMQSKNHFGVIDLATCVPIFRLMSIFKKKLLLVMKTELKAKRISNDGMSNFLIFNTFIRFEVICLMVLHENGLIV